MTLDARKLGFYTLLGIAVYLPVEDYVLRWVPAPLPVLIALRQLPEVIVWAVALGAVGLHLARRGTVRVIGHGTDWFLLGFLAVALLSIAVNGADLLAAFAGLKALVRYIPLVYALIMLAPEPEDLARVPAALVASAALQTVVGLAEWFGGMPARRLFSVLNTYDEAPRISADPELAQLWDQQDVNGLMPRSIAFAFFMLVALVAWMVWRESGSWRYWAGVLVVLLMTYASNSRMAVLSALALVLMHQAATLGMRRMAFAGLALIPLLGGLILATGDTLTGSIYVFQVLTQEYQEHAMSQRLGILVYILPRAFEGGVTVLGYSPDMGVVLPAIATQYQVPEALMDVLFLILDDVYWVSLLLYYGVVGVACLMLFLGKLTFTAYRLFRASTDAQTQRFALAALLLLVLAFPLNLINQAFEVRQFSYYLWLFTGLALASDLVGSRRANGATRVAPETSGL